MAFTTAGTARVVFRGASQFPRLFNDIFAISITGVNPASIAAGAEDTQTYNITSVELGDIVLGVSLSVDQTVDCSINAYVSSAGVVTVRISNLNASSALDFAAGTTIKLIVARPAF